jgi:hypothetical protein
MHIEEKALAHWIDYFYGYGSWQAKFWFVAYEEGGGDQPEEVADKVNYFLKTHSEKTPALCNIRELFKQVRFSIDGPKADLFHTLHDYRFGKNSVQHSIWQNIMGFVCGYENRDFPDPVDYQRHHFASMSSNEALIKLYPLPAHNHAWYYSWLDMPSLPFLRKRSLYDEHVFPSRISTILSNLRTYKPAVVLMYGMNNVNRLKESTVKHFPDAKFKSIKAVGRKIPQHHLADVDGTRIVITTQIPALRHNRIETGFDWNEFGRMLGSRSDNA